MTVIASRQLLLPLHSDVLTAGGKRGGDECAGAGLGATAAAGGVGNLRLCARCRLRVRSLQPFRR